MEIISEINTTLRSDIKALVDKWWNAGMNNAYYDYIRNDINKDIDMILKKHFGDKNGP